MVARSKPVETYEAENADTLLITMGSFSETAMLAIDELEKMAERWGWARFPPVEALPCEGAAKGNAESQNHCCL